MSSKRRSSMTGKFAASGMCLRSFLDVERINQIAHRIVAADSVVHANEQQVWLVVSRLGRYVEDIDPALVQRERLADLLHDNAAGSRVIWREDQFVDYAADIGKPDQ